jgi:tellurite resistance protein
MMRILSTLAACAHVAAADAQVARDWDGTLAASGRTSASRCF